MADSRRTLRRWWQRTPAPARRPHCDGSSDPALRCGFHHVTGISNMFGASDCCCGEPWLTDRCMSGASSGAAVVSESGGFDGD